MVASPKRIKARHDAVQWLWMDASLFSFSVADSSQCCSSGKQSGQWVCLLVFSLAGPVSMLVIHLLNGMLAPWQSLTDTPPPPSLLGFRQAVFSRGCFWMEREQGVRKIICLTCGWGILPACFLLSLHLLIYRTSFLFCPYSFILLSRNLFS